MPNRYWVGGTGNWNTTNTANWDSVSGGSGGQSVPNSGDDVFFDGGSGSGICTISATVSAKSITCTGYNGTITGSSGLNVSGSVTLNNTGMTWSYTGTLTINATGTLTSAGQPFGSINKTTASTTLTLADNLTSTGTITLDNGTLDLNSKTVAAVAFSSNNGNTRTLAFGATGVLNLTGTGSVWVTSTGALLTTSGSKTVNVTSSGSTAISFLTGGMVSANAININFNGAQGGGGLVNYALSLGGNGLLDVDFTGFKGSLNNVVRNWVGNLKISPDMSLTAGTAIQNFVGTGTQLITTNGKTFDFPITQNGVGGTVRLVDSLLMGSTRTYTLTNGTLDLNGNTLTVGSTGSLTTATGTKNITFNGGVLACPAATVTAFNNNAPTGFTTTAGTGTGEIRMTASGAKTFVGGGSIYLCTLNNVGAGALTINNSNNTFTTISNRINPSTLNAPTTFTFTSGTTTTITNWDINGAAAALVTIQSSTVGSQHLLSKSSGPVSANYLSIQDSNALGGASWNASNSINVSNNSGWIFSGTSFSESASDSFSFSDAVFEALTFVASATDSIIFSDLASPNGTFGVSASDTLTITDDAVGWLIFSDTATDTITFTDFVSSTAPIYESVSDSLTLTDSSSFLATLIGSVSDSFVLSDSTSAFGALSVSLDDSLAFLDFAENSASLFASVSDTITFSDVPNVYSLGWTPISSGVANPWSQISSGASNPWSPISSGAANPWTPIT